MLEKKAVWERVNFTRMKLGEEGLKSINQVVSPKQGRWKNHAQTTQTTIESLELAGNEINVAGITALTGALKADKLQKLDVSCNSLCVDGAAALATACSKEP